MSDAASEIARLCAELAAQTARAQAAECDLAQARALASCMEAMIQELKLEIAKLRRDKYGISSERRARLIDQLELQLEELEAAATEDALAAEQTAQDTTSTVRAFTRRKPARKPFPDHLPRERVVVEAPTTCSCCDSDRIVKMGEDSETLFAIGSRTMANDLSLSTLADLIGHACVALARIHELIEQHVLTAARLHGDDTTVPLLARGGTKTARLWTYVRDDGPWGGSAPPAALFKFSRDRQMIHPNAHLAGWQGILQVDACSGNNDLYLADRSPRPARSALCWSHARRKFFDLADIASNVRKSKPAHDISPAALEAVKRIDAIFDIEREINAMDADARLAVRQARSRPLVEELHTWLLDERARMS